MNKNYTISYKDDYNKNHIAFTDKLSDIKFYYDRFGVNNVSYKETRQRLYRYNS